MSNARLKRSSRIEGIGREMDYHLKIQNSVTTPTSSIISPVIATNSIYQQKQREILGLKKLLEMTGQERDYYEDLFYKYKKDLEKMKEEFSRLEGKIIQLKNFNEELNVVNQQLETFRDENCELKTQIEGSDDKISSLNSLINRLKFDVKDISTHYEYAIREKQGLYVALEGVRRQLNDEIQMHDFTREKLSKVEQHLSCAECQWRSKFDELQNELYAQQEKAHIMLLQQEEEFRKTLQMSSALQTTCSSLSNNCENNFQQTGNNSRKVLDWQTKMNFYTKISELQQQLHKSSSIIVELYSENQYLRSVSKRTEKFHRFASSFDSANNFVGFKKNYYSCNTRRTYQECEPIVVEPDENIVSSTLVAEPCLIETSSCLNNNLNLFKEVEIELKQDSFLAGVMNFPSTFA